MEGVRERHHYVFYWVMNARDRRIHGREMLEQSYGRALDDGDIDAVGEGEDGRPISAV